MRNGRALHNRLLKLEASPHALSTEEKWKLVDRIALDSVPAADLELLDQLRTLEAAGSTALATPEQRAAAERFEDAFTTALTGGLVRFTISEFDEILDVR